MKKFPIILWLTLGSALLVQTRLMAQSYGNYSVTVEVEGNGFAHVSIIYFDDGTWNPPALPTYGWDPCCDALSLVVSFPQPQVFTEVVAPPEPTSSHMVAINGLPHVFEQTDVPMGFLPGQLAQYTFIFKELYTLPLGMGVELEDLALNVTQDLLTDSTYQTWSSPSDDEARFIVRFSPSTIIGVEETVDGRNPDISSVNGELRISGMDDQDDYMLIVFDMQGKEILSKEINDSGQLSVNIHTLPKGIYMVNLTDGKGIRVTRRVVR